VVLH